MTIANIIRIGMWICVLPIFIILFLIAMAYLLVIETFVASYDFLLRTGDPVFVTTKEILEEVFKTVQREIRRFGEK